MSIDTYMKRVYGASSVEEANQVRSEVVLEQLRLEGFRGSTVPEIRLLHPERPGARGDHHGSWSGVLSNLHRDGVVERLTEQRANHDVYVLPQFVEGRETRLQGRKPKPLEMTLAHWMTPEDGDVRTRARKYPNAFVTDLERAWAGHCPDGSQLDYRIKVEKGEA